MPIFFPLQLDNRRRRWARIAVAWAALLGSCAAQSLARPGWAGSGLAPESWYQHAVFYRIDTPAQMPTRSQLPSLQAFGVDAIVLTTADVPAASAVPSAADGGDAPLGLDDLLFECSRLHIRVLVPLSLPVNGGDVTALARSWLYRGAGGFVVSSAAGAAPGASAVPPAAGQSVHAIHLAKVAPDLPGVAALHVLLASFAGDRILVADGVPLTSSFQLQIAALNAGPEAPQPPARALLTPVAGQALTPIEAARLLATPYPAMLDSELLTPALLASVFPPLKAAEEPTTVAAPAPPPPPSNVYGTYKPYVPKDLSAERREEAAQKKAEAAAEKIAVDTFPVQPMYEAMGTSVEAKAAFYHRLVQLHRARTSRSGAALTPVELASTAFAWTIAHGYGGTIVVVCNPLASSQRLVLPGHESFRTLIHTAAASGIVHSNDVSVGPMGVYIGQETAGYE